ncbi:MAG: hypothetical protein J4F42_15495 [Desulfurellaceae bacterium]|nr:hypothetical protein [Desulfurellaceae bacterium]
MFGKLGYLDDVQDANLSLTWVNNRLTGNGPLPESRLKRDRSAVFTHPDRFQPVLWFVNGNYRRALSSQLTLSTNLFGRLLDVDQFNRDVEEDVDARTNQKGWGGAAHAAERHRRCRLCRLDPGPPDCRAGRRGRRQF